MDLDLVHVDAIGADGHKHLVTVTSGMLAVSGRKAKRIRPMLLQQRSLAEVSSVATSCQHDRAIDSDLFAVEKVLAASDIVPILDDFRHLGLLDELDALWLLLRKLFESLHERICDSHTGEFGIVASMGSRLRVATTTSCQKQLKSKKRLQSLPKTRNEGQVKVEHILQPLDGGGRLVGENLDEVGPGLVTSGLEGIIVELLDAVADLVVDLRPRKGTVNTGSGLRGVASHEVCAGSVSGNGDITITEVSRTVLVQQHNIATGKVDGMRRAQTGN